jgi:hypothetical protein
VLPPPVKFLLLSTADTASSNSCIPFTAMLILAKAEAAFAVYSSCEIPLGLAYGINSTVLQCPKWILILVVGILNSHFHVLWMCLQ